MTTPCTYVVTTRSGAEYRCTRTGEHPGDGRGCVLIGETVDDKHDASEARDC